ncbi:MAG: hypothetical protein AAFQ92_27505 [Bacteroidota bacterium]
MLGELSRFNSDKLKNKYDFETMDRMMSDKTDRLYDLIESLEKKFPDTPIPDIEGNSSTDLRPNDLSLSPRATSSAKTHNERKIQNSSFEPSTKISIIDLANHLLDLADALEGRKSSSILLQKYINPKLRSLKIVCDTYAKNNQNEKQYSFISKELHRIAKEVDLAHSESAKILARDVGQRDELLTHFFNIRLVHLANLIRKTSGSIINR